MSEVMVSSGKTLNKAIEMGLDLWGLTKSEVDIEIIQTETKRFFGILGTRPAVVRLIKKMEIQNSDTKGQMIESQIAYTDKTVVSQYTGRKLEDGKEKGIELGSVWVKDGQVFCKETANHYPTISPAKGVSLYKNGELIRKTTVLTERDIVKIELKTERKEPSWSISLDSTKMEATLNLEPGYRKTYRLVDQEPSSHIQLEVTQQEEIVNPLEATLIEQKMKELGVTTGIQRREILKAMSSTEPGKYIIAKGVEPINGEDGWLETIVDTKLESNWLKLFENGNVSFQKLITQLKIEIGHLLGIIHPPKPGKTGLTVTGEVVNPAVPRDMMVHAGSGVDIIDQGSKIVAVESGRLSIKYKELKALVSIVPRLSHETDVDTTSGNIDYLGDIEIKGNVNEGMVVHALSDLFIHGTVDHSKLTAGNSIIIGQNIFNSQLEAGINNEAVTEIESLLKRVAVELKGLALAINQVYESPVFKTSDIVKMGLSSLIKILLEKKFNTLPQLIKELNERLLKVEPLLFGDMEIQELSNELDNGFIKIKPSQFQEAADILSLAGRINKLLDISTDFQDQEAIIIIPYSLNSNLTCYGDISIIGKGCINSTVHSKGKVKINGILCGGEVYAANGVEAEETGTKGGLVTRIRVPNGKSIKINLAMEGTVIQIGDLSYQFERAEKNVFARVVSGKILLF